MIIKPYSITRLREIAKRFTPTRKNGTEVHSAAADSRGLESAAQGLAEGPPDVLLWRETPQYGHFILLHRTGSEGSSGIELFDPLGTTARRDPGSTWTHYLDDPLGLNGGGLRDMLAAFRGRPSALLHRARGGSAGCRNLLVRTLVPSSRGCPRRPLHLHSRLVINSRPVFPALYTTTRHVDLTDLDRLM